MGGDSAGVSGSQLSLRADPKVFRKGDFLIGCTSSFRMIQVLRFHVVPPEHPKDMDNYEYMVCHFVEECRKEFKEHGNLQTKEGVDSAGTFLVGYRGGLFRVDSDFQVGEFHHCFGAVGCGMDPAHGALFALQQSSLPPTEKIRIALEAAEQFCTDVRQPFVIETLAVSA